MKKTKKVLIIGTTGLDSDTVSNIVNTVLNENNERIMFTCIGYSENNYYKKIDQSIECIGVKDPFTKIRYRIARRLSLIINCDNYNITQNYIYNQVKKHCMGDKYDLVISCSGRFCHTSAAYNYAFANKIPLRIVFFDSFVYNPYTRNRKLRKRVENKWFSYAEKVFINIEAQDIIQGYTNKVSFFKIPIKDFKFDFNKGHNYMYGGLFYRGIREPTTLIEFANTLDDSLDKIVCYSNYEKQLIHRNISSFGLISHDEYIKKCKNAKALIYIGNSATTVKSSKFLEYISFRKPIIGINVSNDDEVRRYPFYFDSNTKNLNQLIDAIDVNRLKAYNIIDNYPDRNPSNLFNTLFL